MKRNIALLLAVIFTFSLLSFAQQPWSGILTSSQAIDWSNAGAGTIPPRTTVCTNLTASASASQINSALSSCPSGQTVYLAAGTYTINRTIQVPSNVTLRGAGADKTILKATGSGGYVVALGSGGPSYSPVNITGGATNGSTSITLSSTSGVQNGMYLVITQPNTGIVTSNGSEGTCTWCDGWTSNGSLARGQIVQVTGVSGSTVSISPGLYGAYTNSPVAVPFNMSASYAGVEDLQVYATNSGYGADFGLTSCAYCWVKGVEGNYTDGDFVDVGWGYRDSILNSYFSNAYLHTPGSHDSDIDLAYKTSASLVQNNIIERAHASIMMEWGAAGNVIGYNYTEGEFDAGAPNFLIGGISFHGAHPQYNLIEGNVLTQIKADSVWGSSSQTTAFRNWVVGTSRVCSPLSGRGTVNCSGAHYSYQADRAMEWSYLALDNNFLGNVVGSARMQSLVNSSGNKLSQQATVEYPQTRSYDATAYGWSFGFGESSDDGSGSGCSGGNAPCHAAGTSKTDFFDGNYNNISRTTTWATGASQTLPASFYLSGKPSWWGNLPFPAIGPNVAGGIGANGHSYGNPAENCFLTVMKGTDGGAGSPLNFNAAQCYGGANATTPVPPTPQSLTGTVIKQ